MRVLLTHERFLPDFGGGGEPFVAGLAANLLRRGVDVTVVTSGDPKLTSFNGIPTIRLPRARHLMNLAVTHIARHARQADLIQTFNYNACLPSLISGRLLRKPVVCLCLCVFRDAWLQLKGPVAGRVYRSVERFLLSRDFDRTLFLSETNRAAGLDFGARAERSLVIDPAVELEDYQPADQKDDVVLFAAKIESRKGTAELLATAQALPDVRFQVLGWGPEAEDFRRSAPSNVEFVGFETGEPFRRRFARARIFFCPSRAEGFPLVLIHAMASGCAVVSTLPLDFAGIRPEPGDVPAMAAAIRRLWTDREESAAIGRMNVKLSRRFGWERFTDTLLNTYEDVLRASRK